MRIAAWSGPRNLSTAMMYAFGNRPDFAVWDEPFYAPYLAHTGLDHPMRDEIVMAHERDPHMVAAMCSGTIPRGKPHFYMKHMALHMLPDFPMDWTTTCTHIHLIRHPARVVASYGAKRGAMSLEDIGFRQQVEVHERVGGVVLDSAETRANPRATLARLCNALDLDFKPEMLSWPRGGHKQDGVWAAHWYGAVHDSTGFAAPEGPLPELSNEKNALVDAALPYYETLRAVAL